MALYNADQEVGASGEPGAHMKGDQQKRIVPLLKRLSVLR